MITKPTVSSLTTSAGAAIITGIIGFAISQSLGLTGDLKSIAVGVSVLVGALIIVIVREHIANLGKQYMRQHTGIEKIYKNLVDAEKDMRTDFEKANDIRLLLQIGRRELGDGEQWSYFWSPMEKKSGSGCKIRILRASANSPFLSEERAKFRQCLVNPIEEWRANMRRLREQIEILKNTHKVAGIEGREHAEPFLWRIFLFDDIAYVSAYLYAHNNDSKAVVYRLTKGETSLFSVFDRYFEYLWKKCESPITAQDPAENEKWANWV